MSLIICVHVEEGIVLAGDSRVSYNKEFDNIKQIGIHASNTTNKIFKCPNNAGIATCGGAAIDGKPITGFVETFIRERIKEDTDVEEIPNLLREYFGLLDPNLDTSFVIAGYKKQGWKYFQKVFRMKLNTDVMEIVNTESQGALWDGETITLTKLLTPVYVKDKEKNQFHLLPNTEIVWNLYTLQDAVDFAKYGIKTTIDTLKFQAVPETVGGPIDILVIKPDGAQWLAKKELRG